LGDKALVGIAGVHFVVGELSRRNWIALPTIRNTRGIDVLATKGNKDIQIQVKTRGNSMRWPLSGEAERLENKNLFYVFVNMREYDAPEYYIVPSGLVSGYVARTHKLFLAEGGRESSIRAFPNAYESFDLNKYKGKWEMLEFT
jgi:hypothetical protein